MGTRERLASIRRKQERADYERYLEKVRKAKSRGWEFREGHDAFTYNEFRQATIHYGALAQMWEMPVEDLVFEEQLAVNNDSIDQAVDLWNAHDNLISLYGVMDREKFRNNERLYFKMLRREYPDDETYDMAMSY